MHTVHHLRAAALSLAFVVGFGLPAAIVAEEGAGAIFGGPGLQGGIEAAAGVSGVTEDDPVETFIGIVETFLSYLTLIAVIMVIIAGFYLMLSFGEEDKKDKAKRIIIYTLIGLVVILLSNVIVGFVRNLVL